MFPCVLADFCVKVRQVHWTAQAQRLNSCVTTVHRPARLRALGKLVNKPPLYLRRSAFHGLSFVTSNCLGKEKRYVEVHKAQAQARITATFGKLCAKRHFEKAAALERSVSCD
jgi:hypothetical protein